MRRFTVPVIVATGLALGWAAPAGAVPLEKLEAQVTGTTTGDSAFGTCTNGDLRSDMTGTYVSEAGGTGSYRIDVCLAFGGTVFNITSGTFTITTPKGATVTGVVEGIGNATFIDDTLTVTGGTRQFKHVSGTIAWDATGGSPNLGSFDADFERT